MAESEKTMDLTIDSVMEDIADTLNLPEEDNDINQELKLPVEEFKKKEEKEDKGEDEEEENPLAEIEAMLDELGAEGDDREEILDAVKKRLDAGEELEAIKKELAEEPEEEAAEEKKEEKPKSKDKAIEKMEKRIHTLTAQRNELQAKLDRKPDDNKQKLSAMTVDDLKDLESQAELALLEGHVGEQELTRNDKLALIKDRNEIRELIRSAPQRLVERQKKQFDKIVPDLQEMFPTAKEQEALTGVAKDIFQATTSFHESDLGWVEAYNLAVRYIRSLPKKDQGKTESISSLKRRLNTLKKKTTLSGKSSVANEGRLATKKLWKKAKEGDIDDQERFIADTLVSQMGIK